MPIYAVEITTIAVISAKDETHAVDVAYRLSGQIFNEDPSPRIEVDGEVKSLGELRHGWDGECIPYGGDGNTRLHDLLPNGEASASTVVLGAVRPGKD